MEYYDINNNLKIVLNKINIVLGLNDSGKSQILNKKNSQMLFLNIKQFCNVFSLKNINQKLIEIIKENAFKIIILDDLFSLLSNENKSLLIDIIKKNNGTLVFNSSKADDIYYADNLLYIEKNEILINKPIKKINQNDIEIMKECLPFVGELSKGLCYFKNINKLYIDSDKLIGALWN